MQPSTHCQQDKDHNHIGALAIRHTLPRESQQLAADFLSQKEALKGHNGVQDALAQLVQGGLVVELPDQRFFVQRQSYKEVCNQYELVMVLLGYAIDLLQNTQLSAAGVNSRGPHSTAPDNRLPAMPSPKILAQLTGDLFESVARQAGNEGIINLIKKTNDQLFYVRLCECTLLEGVEHELAVLCDLYTKNNFGKFWTFLVKYHARRFKILPEIMALL